MKKHPNKKRVLRKMIIKLDWHTYHLAFPPYSPSLTKSYLTAMREWYIYLDGLKKLNCRWIRSWKRNLLESLQTCWIFVTLETIFTKIFPLQNFIFIAGSYARIWEKMNAVNIFSYWQRFDFCDCFSAPAAPLFQVSNFRFLISFWEREKDCNDA